MSKKNTMYICKHLEKVDMSKKLPNGSFALYIANDNKERDRAFVACSIGCIKEMVDKLHQSLTEDMSQVTDVKH